MNTSSPCPDDGLLASVAGMPASHDEAPQTSCETWSMRWLSCRRQEMKCWLAKSLCALRQDFEPASSSNEIFPCRAETCRCVSPSHHPTSISFSNTCSPTLVFLKGMDVSPASQHVINFGHLRGFSASSRASCSKSQLFPTLTYPDTADLELQVGARCSMAPGI